MKYGKELQEILDTLKKDYKIVTIILIGSQNYNIDNEHSDIDAKAFVLPTMDDLYYGNKVSKTYTTKYGLVEVKDIRLLPELLAKANPSALELLASKYYIDLDGRFEDIRKRLPAIFKEVKSKFLYALGGTATQKYSGVIKNNNPKDLHHLRRLEILTRRIFLWGWGFEKSIWFEPSVERRELLDMKENAYLREVSKMLADSFIVGIGDMLEPHKKNAVFADNKTLKKVDNIIKEMVLGD